MDFEREKGVLIEKMGVWLEGAEQLAPLAARIMSTLILTDQNGITFEQLVRDLNASKSTICTHLNSLQASNRISYFTKPGDRKRYFTITPNRLLQTIDGVMANWNTQKQIHKEILQYKEKYNDAHADEAKLPFRLELHKNYLIFLDEAVTAIQKLKQQITNK